MVGEGNGGAGQHGGATPAQAMAVAGAVGRSAAADPHVSLALASALAEPWTPACPTVGRRRV